MSFCVLDHPSTGEKMQRESFKNYSSSNETIQNHVSANITVVTCDRSESDAQFFISQKTDDADTSGMEEGDSHISSSFPRHKIVKRVLTYPKPITYDGLADRAFGYGNQSYNQAIIGIGVKYFMSCAAHFCNDEMQRGATNIISIGCGDGFVDRSTSIIKTYHDHFGSELDIILIDPNPKYEVDFRTVEDLIEKRPNIVGKCSLLIIWPEYESDNDNYDINSIYKLRPRAVLTLMSSASVVVGTSVSF